MPRIIAVYHQKGGVGKTTTAINLGACFAAMGDDTLLIDLDPSSNLTAGLGFKPEGIKHSIGHVLLGNNPLRRVILPTEVTGLDVAPSNHETLTALNFLTLRKRYEYILKDSLTALESEPQPERKESETRQYQWIILDCPPSGGAVIMAALAAAALVIVPVQCEYYSLQALERVFFNIRQARAKTNSRLSYRLLVTMLDLRGKMHLNVLSKVREYYANALLNTMIYYDSKLQYSQMIGKPICQYAPKARAALQYRTLAEELRSYMQSRNI